MSASINNSKLEYDLLEKLSESLKNILFIYLPRRNNNFMNKKNLLITEKLKASDYLPISDLHITGRSSCMFEAAFFEKKTLIYNFFIEFENQLESLKKNLSNYPSLYRFVDKKDDLISIIKEELKNKEININEVKAQNLYLEGYNTNIDNFINKIHNNQ